MARKKPARKPRSVVRWEPVAEGTERLAVTGGWVYRTFKRGAGISTCFVPREAAADTRALEQARTAALELKRKLEKLKVLLDQLSAARILRKTQVKGRVH